MPDRRLRTSEAREYMYILKKDMYSLASDVLCASVRHMYCSVVVKRLSAIVPALA